MHLYQNLRLERKKNTEKQYEDFLKNPMKTAKSPEYAADIFNARIGDGKPFVFNGNVINNGSITNLPNEACVEIPVIADRQGLKCVLKCPIFCLIRPLK